MGRWHELLGHSATSSIHGKVRDWSKSKEVFFQVMEPMEAVGSLNISLEDRKGSRLTRKKPVTSLWNHRERGSTKVNFLLSRLEVEATDPPNMPPHIFSNS